MDRTLHEFRDLVKGPEIDLAGAALAVARIEYPDLPPIRSLAALDELAARSAVSTAGGGRRALDRLCDFLFAGEGFRGNAEDYYDPRNSCLNDVLDRRLGIPITLAVGDVFEIVGTGVTLAKETTLQPWTPGATSFVKVTPDSNSDGIRGPAPHQQVPWNPVLRKGQPLSASVMVRPYADNMSFQLAVEAWDAANTLIQTDTSATFALGVGSTGQWLPLTLEDFNYDTRTVLLFLTVKVVVTAGFAAFGVDAAQLEQAFIATPWVPPPTNV